MIGDHEERDLSPTPRTREVRHGLIKARRRRTVNHDVSHLTVLGLWVSASFRVLMPVNPYRNGTGRPGEERERKKSNTVVGCQR
jgi:hypothetical protein